MINDRTVTERALTQIAIELQYQNDLKKYELTKEKWKEEGTVGILELPERMRIIDGFGKDVGFTRES
ncbi:hypothetical protein [Methanobrevibacter sp.]|uniref:hypothetical protein n=1 Tax=Methanobrevibacter sp. TaxID=66852 RepID=UPI002601A395|nr:hypothetical protein [uncultured Methanobrevibacter sp.]